jgi:hypothetical protein
MERRYTESEVQMSLSQPYASAARRMSLTYPFGKRKHEGMLHKDYFNLNTKDTPCLSVRTNDTAVSLEFPNLQLSAKQKICRRYFSDT